MANENNEFSLLLGCGGHTVGDLITCNGVENVIINFAKHLDNVNKVTDFLDFQCGLFDRPIGDWNKVVNTIQVLRNTYNLIDDKLWQSLQIWFPMHKRCGGYLRLVLNSDVPKYLIIQEEFVVPNKRT